MSLIEKSSNFVFFNLFVDITFFPKSDNSLLKDKLILFWFLSSFIFTIKKIHFKFFLNKIKYYNNEK